MPVYGMLSLIGILQCEHCDEALEVRECTVGDLSSGSRIMASPKFVPSFSPALTRGAKGPFLSSGITDDCTLLPPTGPVD